MEEVWRLKRWEIGRWNPTWIEVRRSRLTNDKPEETENFTWRLICFQKNCLCSLFQKIEKENCYKIMFETMKQNTILPKTSKKVMLSIFIFILFRFLYSDFLKILRNTFFQKLENQNTEMKTQDETRFRRRYQTWPDPRCEKRKCLDLSSGLSI